jgi:hypothetical protein
MCLVQASILLQVSAINRHPQRDADTKEYIKLIRHSRMYNIKYKNM